MLELDDLLNRSRGCLRSIIFCLREVASAPSPAAVNTHSSTLRHLVLDIRTVARDPNGLAVSVVYTKEVLELMLRDCANLSQLALHTPPLTLDYHQFDAEDGAEDDPQGLFHDTWVSNKHLLPNARWSISDTSSGSTLRLC